MADIVAELLARGFTNEDLRAAADAIEGHLNATQFNKKKQLKKFWNWIGNHACFTMDYEKQAGPEVLPKALDCLLYSPRQKAYGVHLRAVGDDIDKDRLKLCFNLDTPYLHDPYELLTSQLYNTDCGALPVGSVTVYSVSSYEDPPEPDCDLTRKKFMRKYPDAVELI